MPAEPASIERSQLRSVPLHEVDIYRLYAWGARNGYQDHADALRALLDCVDDPYNLWKCRRAQLVRDMKAEFESAAAWWQDQAEKRRDPAAAEIASRLKRRLAQLEAAS